MILPTKHISEERALLTVGAKVLNRLSQPKTVSTLWEEMTRRPLAQRDRTPTLRYDAYLLTLSLLFMIDAIELNNGLLYRRRP